MELMNQADAAAVHILWQRRISKRIVTDSMMSGTMSARCPSVCSDLT